jgi:hypothetical protein
MGIDGLLGPPVKIHMSPKHVNVHASWLWLSYWLVFLLLKMDIPFIDELLERLPVPEFTRNVILSQQNF